MVIAGLFAACFGLVSAGTGRAEDRKIKDITFGASATYTAGTTYSSGFLVSAYYEGVLLINVTTITGTPTLDIDVQTSDDNSTYYHHTRLDQIRVVSSTAVKLTNLGKYIRIKHTVEGSTSMVYTIKSIFKN
uniref:Uncharacterized protein n=1 Tax=viral metagenome TaxID=1070528 RepID=A0A6M3ITU1_9ZZZZ